MKLWRWRGKRIEDPVKERIAGTEKLRGWLAAEMFNVSSTSGLDVVKHDMAVGTIVEGLFVSVMHHLTVMVMMRNAGY